MTPTIATISRAARFGRFVLLDHASVSWQWSQPTPKERMNP